MPDKLIPLPRIRQHGPTGDLLQWPTFDEDPAVLQTWWSGRAPPQTDLPRARRFSWRRMAGTGIRGITLGILLVGFICGLVPAYSWWLADWHWVFGLAGIGAGALLLGSEGAVLALAGIALVQAFTRVIAAPETSLIWLVVGVVGRTLWEWLLIAIKH